MANNQDENLMLEDDAFDEEDTSLQTTIAQTNIAKSGTASIAEKAAQNAADRNALQLCANLPITAPPEAFEFCKALDGKEVDFAKAYIKHHDHGKTGDPCKEVGIC